MGVPMLSLALLGFFIATCTSTDQTEPYHAVVIGAGWAGLSAARKLLDNGVKNILVLEANDYIGGRSKTVNGDGSINDPKRDTSNKPIELGSEWLYMETDHEEYLKRSNYLEGAHADPDGDAYFLTMDRVQYYLRTKLSDGSMSTRALKDAEKSDLERRVWGLFLEFRDAILEKHPDISYDDVAESFKENYLGNKKDKEFINAAIGAAKILYGEETEKLALPNYDWLSDDGSANYYMSVPGVGFGNVAAEVTSSFTDKVELNAKVTEVNYNDPGNVVISYTQSGETKKSISCKTVIITVSLGVLKAGTISFIPNLPAWKQNVINNMGFGVINKAAMQWENLGEDVVWPIDPIWFQLLTPSSAVTERWTTFFNPTKLKGVPTIVAWVGGKEAREIEKQTDEEILDEVMDNMKAMFPTIKRPDRVVITRWGQEENILGTYSYENVGRNINQDSFTLQQNIEGRLFFAGEAAAGSSYGSTESAWNSGEKAATEIIKALTSR